MEQEIPEQQNAPVEAESKTRRDPRQREGFTSVEDAIISWFYFCEQFTDTKKLQQYIQNLPISTTTARFIEILNSPELIQRTRKELKDDILGYKPATPTLFEEYYLIRAIELLKPKDFDEILVKFPQFFHPSRTPSSLRQMEERLKKKGIINSELAQVQIDQFMSEVRSKIGETPLLPFPGDYEDPVAEVEKLMGDSDEMDGEQMLPSLDDVIADADKKMTKGTFAVLIGQSGVFPINKTKIIVGRKSPKSKAEIDIDSSDADALSHVSRHHIEITLSNDLRFYVKVLGKLIIINGQIYTQSQVILLKDLDVIDAGGRVLLFHENKQLFDRIRSQ